MALRAKKPEAITKRLKLMLYGMQGVGKTTAAIQFPRSYVIDCERGSENYTKQMQTSNSEVFASNDPDEIIAEVRSLSTEPHDFRTVVIDPVNMMESEIIARATAKYKADKKEGGDMRVWGDRDKACKRLANILLAIDMNVIVTCHGKIDYGENMVKLGNTFDAWKKWPYLFDLVLEIERRGAKRVAIVRKTRIEAFPDGDTFDFSYAEITRRYGLGEMERVATVAGVATAAQISELTNLLGKVALPEGTTDKWLAKAKVEDLQDLPPATMQACIDWLNTLVKGKV